MERLGDRQITLQHGSPCPLLHLIDGHCREIGKGLYKGDITRMVEVRTHATVEDNGPHTRAFHAQRTEQCAVGWPTRGVGPKLVELIAT